MILNESGLVAGWCVGAVPPHALSATFIVKGTFKLASGGPAVAAPGQKLLDGDVHEDDDPARPLRYASDFAWHKPRTDVLLVGTCHPPARTEACLVALQVGSWHKRLAVVGDRSRRTFLLFTYPSEPAPFRRLELSYSRSYGGAGYAMNPCGRGHGPAGELRYPLPNILDYDRLNVDPESRPQPAGFGPLPPSSPQRLTKSGTYNRAWLKRKWPRFPDDFDWTFFNAAPRDQQLDPWLRGDEKILLQHLVPSRPVFASALPAIRPRWFLREAARTREVALNLDTLWIDSDALEMVLVWRGVAAIEHRKMREILDHRIVVERLADEPGTLEHYARLPEPPVEPPVPEVVPLPPRPAFGPADGEISARLQSAWEKLKARAPQIAEKLGPPPTPVPPAPPPPWTRERVAAQAGERPNFSGENLSGLDLSGMELAGAVFKGANLRGARLSKADLTGANLAEADLAEASLDEATLLGADLTGASLERATLCRANLDGADLNGTRLGGADFSGCSAGGAGFYGADLTAAVLRDARLVGADFREAVAEKADFRGASLAGASLAKARAAGAVFEGADLTGFRGNEGADFTGANLKSVRAEKSVWEESKLDGADFGGAALSRANFTSASAVKAVFRRADLRWARFMETRLDGADLTQVNLFRGSLEAASLRDAQLVGSNLFEVEFLDAATEGARFEKSDLTGTKLA